MSLESEAIEKYSLCIEESDFLEDKTIWVAHLSNGLTVYQDDHKSGKEEPIAWKRLFSYCNEEGVDISGMYLKFRSNRKLMPDADDCDGYYFAYGALREFDERITRAYYVCGYCLENTLFYDWYMTPELTKSMPRKRKLNKEDIQDKRLILNSSVKNQFTSYYSTL